MSQLSNLTMSSEIEMNDLSRELEAEQDGTNKQLEESNSGGKDYIISAWAWTSTTLFVLFVG
jgi:hypothetical protein